MMGNRDPQKQLQGMKENQQVVFMSDGGETVRRLQEYLHPCSEHVIDWFHITMRLTVLQQQTKTLQAEQPEVGEEVAKQLESVKHLLWHGNAQGTARRVRRTDHRAGSSSSVLARS